MWRIGPHERFLHHFRLSSSVSRLIKQGRLRRWLLLLRRVAESIAFNLVPLLLEERSPLLRGIELERDRWHVVASPANRRDRLVVWPNLRPHVFLVHLLPRQSTATSLHQSLILLLEFLVFLDQVHVLDLKFRESALHCLNELAIVQLLELQRSHSSIGLP